MGWCGEGGISGGSIGGEEAAGREASEEDERWGRRGARKMTGALFSSPKILQNFSDFLSHRIFRRMH